jgi:uncharacterized phiE125 gp8 family phage protein
MSNRRIAAATVLPFTLEEIKAHLNMLLDPDEVQDARLTGLILAAMEECEKKTMRSIMTQTREETRDEFPDSGWIALAYPPIQSIESIKYLDTSGEWQTLSPSSYKLDNSSDSKPGWAVPSRGLMWPLTYDEINAVQIRYIAGYASAAEVPPPLKQWMKLRIGDFDANRETVNVGNITSSFDYADSLLRLYRIFL